MFPTVIPSEAEGSEIPPLRCATVGMTTRKNPRSMAGIFGLFGVGGQLQFDDFVGV
jgi:hypothetical protein